MLRTKTVFLNNINGSTLNIEFVSFIWKQVPLCGRGTCLSQPSNCYKTIQFKTQCLAFFTAVPPTVELHHKEMVDERVACLILLNNRRRMWRSICFKTLLLSLLLLRVFLLWHFWVPRVKCFFFIFDVPSAFINASCKGFGGEAGDEGRPDAHSAVGSKIFAEHRAAGRAMLTCSSSNSASLHSTKCSPPEPRGLSQVSHSPSCTRILEVTFCHMGRWDELRQDWSFCHQASPNLKTQLQCPNVDDTTRQQQNAMKRSDCPSSWNLTDGRGGDKVAAECRWYGCCDGDVPSSGRMTMRRRRRV